MLIQTLDVIRKLLPLTESSNDLAAQGSALSLMALTLSKMGRHEEASKVRAKARSVHCNAVEFYTAQLSSRDHAIQSAAYSQLALAYKELGRITEAIDMRAKAKAVQARIDKESCSSLSTDILAHPANLPFEFNPDARLHSDGLELKHIAGENDAVEHNKVNSTQTTGEGVGTVQVKLNTEGFEAGDDLLGLCKGKSREADKQEANRDAPPPRTMSIDKATCAENLAHTESEALGVTPLHRGQDACGRTRAGPTPQSSPVKQLRTDYGSVRVEWQGIDSDDSASWDVVVRKLMNFCADELWEQAATMRDVIVPLAASLVESEPRVALDMYSSLGIALENVARRKQDEEEASLLWAESIVMQQRARDVARRSLCF